MPNGYQTLRDDARTEASGRKAWRTLADRRGTYIERLEAALREAGVPLSAATLRGFDASREAIALSRQHLAAMGEIRSTRSARVGPAARVSRDPVGSRVEGVAPGAARSPSSPGQPTQGPRRAA